MNIDEEKKTMLLNSINRSIASLIDLKSKLDTNQRFFAKNEFTDFELNFIECLIASLSGKKIEIFPDGKTNFYEVTK